MRPKKVILYVEFDEQNLSTLSFSLETNGYRVLRAATYTEGLALFIQNAVDLVAVNFLLPGKNGADLIDELKKLRSHVPMILFADPKKAGLHLADAVLPAKTVSMAEILERFKVMSARKRGPRKGGVHFSRPVAGELAEPATAGVA